MPEEYTLKINTEVDTSGLDNGLDQLEQMATDGINALGEVLSTVASATISGIIGAIISQMNFAPIAEAISAGLSALATQVAGFASGIVAALGPVGTAAVVIGGVVSAIGIYCLSLDTYNEYNERMKAANESLAESHAKLRQAFVDTGDSALAFINGISSADPVLEGLNEKIFITGESQTELATQISDIQAGISQTLATAVEERGALNETEIVGIEEKMARIDELNQQQLENQNAYAEQVTAQAQAMAENQNLTLEEYEIYAQEYIQKAQSVRDETVSLLEQQRDNQIALNQEMLGTSAEYNEEWLAQANQAAWDDYEIAVTAANEKCGATIQLLADEYEQRAGYMTSSMAAIEEFNQQEEAEESKHKSNLEALELSYNERFKAYRQQGLSEETSAAKAAADIEMDIDEEKLRHQEEMDRLALNKSSIASQKQLTQQQGTWLSMLGLAEMYGIDISDESSAMVDSMMESWGTLDGYDSGSNAMWGLLQGLSDMEPRLYLKCEAIGATCVAKINAKLGNASPSKKMRQSGKWLMQGAEIGMSDEAPRLYQQTERIAQNILSRFGGTDPSSLVSKMRAAVSSGAGRLTAGFVNQLHYQASVSAGAQAAAARAATRTTPNAIENHIVIDGREFAIVTTPYIEEEMGYR